MLLSKILIYPDQRKASTSWSRFVSRASNYLNGRQRLSASTLARLKKKLVITFVFPLVGFRLPFLPRFWLPFDWVTSCSTLGLAIAPLLYTYGLLVQYQLRGVWGVKERSGKFAGFMVTSSGWRLAFDRILLTKIHHLLRLPSMPRICPLLASEFLISLFLIA